MPDWSDDKRESIKHTVIGLIAVHAVCVIAVLGLPFKWNILLLIFLLAATSALVFRPKLSFATFFMLLIIYAVPLERWNWKVWFTLRPIIVVSLFCFYLMLIRHSLVGFRVNRRTKQILLLFCMMTGAFLFSSVNALSFLKSFRVTVLNMTLFMLFFIVVQLTTDVTRLRKYIGHWMIAGSLLCLFGLAQLIGNLYGLDLDALLFPSFELMPMGHTEFNLAGMVGFRIRSMFTDTNNFAGFLNTVFPFFLAAAIYFLSIRMRRRFLLFAVGSLIVGSTLILTLSRSGWVGLLFGLTVVLVDKRRHIFRYGNVKYILLPLLLLLLAVAPLSEFVSRSVEGRLVEDRSLEIHRFVAQSAISMFYRNPIFGVGIGNWGEYYGRYYKPGHEHWNAHSAYLQILSEVGIVGFVLYLVLFYLVLKQILYFKKNTRGYDSEVLGSGLLAGFIALLGANIFYQNYTFQFFIVFLGLSFVSGNVVERQEE
ncbi:MAG: O-antigen ligase family protein [Candidatus Zixiibacteriota bacterium]|nr:MAG: O-antigen ligase family protein [candidate division Zixibacteria bacterium]